MTQISLAKCKVDQLVSLCEEFGNQPDDYNLFLVGKLQV